MLITIIARVQITLLQLVSSMVVRLSVTYVAEENNITKKKRIIFFSGLQLATDKKGKFVYVFDRAGSQPVPGRTSDNRL